MTHQLYPSITVNLPIIAHNYRQIVKRCSALDIAVTGVVKATDSYAHGHYEIASLMMQSGCHSVGDSRMLTIKQLKENGFKGTVLLLRVPMMSELEIVADYADMSLQSEVKTLKKLSEICEKKSVVHGVVLMVDLGDLREGFFKEADLIDAAYMVENELKGLHLLGIGTNLGCYGAICPDQDNLGKLVMLAKTIERHINRKLEIVSGGATSSLPLIYGDTMPKGITHLRIGEGAIIAKDMANFWHLDTPDLKQGAYMIQAEIIEIKNKASHPIGKVFIDAFGNKPQFEDIGNRRRALLALGRRDFGDLSALDIKEKGAIIIGASSDHLIVDITDAQKTFDIGDIMTFDCYYQGMLYAMQSPFVYKNYQTNA